MNDTHAQYRHPLATHAAGTVLGYRRNGSPIYAIAGGNGEGEGGAGSGANDQGAAGGTGSGGQGTGQQGGTDNGQGASAGTDWQAEARKWEKRAKDNKDAADRLAAFEAAQMTEQEKAVKAASEQGRTAALAEAAPAIAQARLEAAAARKGVDLTPFADLLDVSKFITNGEVDTAAITAAVDKLATLAPRGAGRSGGDMGGGGSGDTPASLDKQIAEAEARRDFRTAIALKRQRAAQT